MTGFRILLATDGSAGADQALNLLVASFDPANVERVEVLSVVPQLGPWLRDASEESLALTEVSSSERGKRVADAAAERLRTAGFDAREAVLYGHPAETIVALAEARRPDVVVLGTRGLSGLQRQLAGSVSSKVARYAPTSVLVARTSGPIRQILVGYDASPDADEALVLVATLPLLTGVGVTVCSAYDVAHPFASGVAPTMVEEARLAYADCNRWAKEAAEFMAAEATRRLSDAGVVATARTALGSAHEQLAIAASELDADLIVVGSRGLSAIQRFFLGSTSAALVAHPPVSVLVARGAREPLPTDRAKVALGRVPVTPAVGGASYEPWAVTRPAPRPSPVRWALRITGGRAVVPPGLSGSVAAPSSSD